MKRLLATYWWHYWGLNRFSWASTQRVWDLESGGALTSPSSSPLADSWTSCAVYGGRLVTNTKKPRTHSLSCTVCFQQTTLNTNTQTTHYITHRPSQIPYMEWSFFFFFSFPSFLHLSLPSTRFRTVTRLLILKFISSSSIGFSWEI